MPRYYFANPYGKETGNPNAVPIAQGINNIATAFFGDPNADPYQQERDRASAEKTRAETEVLQRKQGAALRFHEALKTLPPEQRRDAITAASMQYADETGDVEGAAKIARMWASLSDQPDDLRADAAVASGQQINPTDTFSLEGRDDMRRMVVQDKITESMNTPHTVPEGGQLVIPSQMPGAQMPNIYTPPAATPPTQFNAPITPPPLNQPLPSAPAAPTMTPAAPTGGSGVLYERPRRPEPVPKDVMDDISGMVTSLDNMNTMYNNRDVFGPVEGRLRQAIPGGYGGTRANDAYAAQSNARADLQSVIKGIPSNTDQRIFENIIVRPGDGEDLIRAKKELFDKLVGLKLRNIVANYAGTKQALPPAVLKLIENRGIRVDDLSRMDNSPEGIIRDMDSLGQQAASIGGGAAEVVPQGWDPEDWKYLTPEEKASLRGGQ